MVGGDSKVWAYQVVRPLLVGGGGYWGKASGLLALPNLMLQCAGRITAL